MKVLQISGTNYINQKGIKNNNRYNPKFMGKEDVFAKNSVKWLEPLVKKGLEKPTVIRTLEDYISLGKYNYVQDNQYQFEKMLKFDTIHPSLRDGVIEFVQNQINYENNYDAEKEITNLQRRIDECHNNNNWLNEVINIIKIGKPQNDIKNKIDLIPLITSWILFDAVKHPLKSSPFFWLFCRIY